MVSVSLSKDTLYIPLDCSNISGLIRPFGHINDGPIPIKAQSGSVDLTTQYRDIGITSIRTHDLVRLI
jgi:hypothetical protein